MVIFQVRDIAIPGNLASGCVLGMIDRCVGKVVSWYMLSRGNLVFVDTSTARLEFPLKY